MKWVRILISLRQYSGIWIGFIVYTVYLIIKSIRKIRKIKEIHPARFNKWFPVVISFIFGVVDIAVYFISNVMITALVPMLQFAELLFLIEILICGIFLGCPLMALINQIRIQRKDNTTALRDTHKKIAISAITVVFFVIIMILPFTISSTNAIPGNLPPKPMVFAHRGGGYLGPENTIAGYQAMLPFNVVGCDLDLRISADGVPFLCHDDTFYRTTNVAQLFPGSENNPVENFTISDIEQLDAGSWFLNTPNAIIAANYVNQTTLAGYRGAKVATLNAAISFCEEHNWSVDCDFKDLSINNPNDVPYINLIMGMLLNSTIPHFYIEDFKTNLTDPRIIWYSLDFNSSPATLKAEGYSLLQIEDLTQPPSEFQKFTDAGFPVYYQFADDAVAYSAAWCLGCKYVLSDTPFLFTQMNSPIWYLRMPEWYGLWITLEALIACAFIVAIIYQKGIVLTRGAIVR